MIGSKMINNNARLIGTMVTDLVFNHQTNNICFYKLEIAVKRDSGYEDIIPVIVPEYLIDADNNYCSGKRVEIIGNYRSYNFYTDDAEKKSKLILAVFALEINNAANIEEDVNDLFLDGFICKSPVYRETPLGRRITELLVAVNRTTKSKNNIPVKSDYIPCITWGKDAEFAKSYINISEHIYIWGRIQSREYLKRYNDGKEEIKTAYEISVQKISKQY